jgi:hypothetical protein
MKNTVIGDCKVFVQRTKTNLKRYVKSHIIVQDFFSIQTQENEAIRLIFAVVPLVISKATAD